MKNEKSWMRRLVLALVTITIANVCWSNHALKYTRIELLQQKILRNHTPGDTMVVGDQKYWYMIGGIYHKGDIRGIVYYINEKEGIMKICEPRSRMVNYQGYLYCAPLHVYEEIYRDTPWHIFTLDEMKIYGIHFHLIDYNRTWEQGDTYHTLYVSQAYWTSSFSRRGEPVHYTIDGDIASSIPRFHYVDGKQIYYKAGCIGTMDVPFNPSLISQYEPKEK